MAEMPSFLKKKIAGLPAGVWLAVVVAGVGVGIYLRKKNQAAQDAASQDAGGTQVDQGGQVVPYDQLQGSGGYLSTGGGFAGPPALGGGAIRIQGPRKPIRIIVRTQRPPAHKKKHPRQQPRRRR